MTTEPADKDALARELRESRRMHEAPESLVLKAIGLFAPRASSAAAAAPSALRRLVASLSFDSRDLAPLVPGLRSEAAHTRQVLYAADGRDVDLRIASTGDEGRYVISGQVLGPDATGVSVLSGPGTTWTAAWNELSEFHFDAVGPGSWQLTLRTAEWELLLPPLHLEPAP